MKTTLAILISGLLLCGCSQKTASSKSTAMDRIQAGKDLAWNGGSSVLRVTKRDGNSLEGIQIINTASNGLKMIITADTGTVSPGSETNALDSSCVKITLQNMNCQTTAGVRMTAKEFIVDLHE